MKLLEAVEWRQPGDFTTICNSFVELRFIIHVEVVVEVLVMRFPPNRGLNLTLCSNAEAFIVLVVLTCAIYAVSSS